METDTKVYLRKKFMQYYSSHEVAAPAEIASREFGTGTLETKIKVRHKSFSSQRDLSNFLKREVPFYISYSAAYYEFPENQPMASKNWRGADLVFDLDTDMSMLSAKKLAVVKEETQNLLDFLLADFGFPKGEIEINFSGGKGYHLKVFSERVKKLGGIERRSIVDYVSGSGLDIKDFLSLEAEGGHPVVRGPREGEAGWRGRVYAVMMSFLTSSVEELQELDGIGPKKAQWLYENRERFKKALERGSWGDFAESSQALISRVLKKYAVKAAQDIDGSVTIDTTRLIRLPDTLHGGSGLVAKRVANLDSFDPLKDAVAFGKEEVKVQLKEKVEFDLGDRSFSLLPGMVSVPEYAAVYLLLKDKAEVVR